MLTYIVFVPGMRHGFSLAFAPLMLGDGTTLRDNQHNLNVYKVRDC